MQELDNLLTIKIGGKNQEYNIQSGNVISLLKKMKYLNEAAARKSIKNYSNPFQDKTQQQSFIIRSMENCKNDKQDKAFAGNASQIKNLNHSNNQSSHKNEDYWEKAASNLRQSMKVIEKNKKSPTSFKSQSQSMNFPQKEYYQNQPSASFLASNTQCSKKVTQQINFLPQKNIYLQTIQEIPSTPLLRSPIFKTGCPYARPPTLRKSQLFMFQTPVFPEQQTPFDKLVKSSGPLPQKFDLKPLMRFFRQRNHRVWPPSFELDNSIAERRMNEFISSIKKPQPSTPFEYTENDRIPTSYLPERGNYLLIPSVNKLRRQKIRQVMAVSNVKIMNEHGYIQFKESISLLKKQIPKALEIGQSFFQIQDSEWKHKKHRLLLRNFQNFRSIPQSQYQSFFPLLYRWLKSNSYELVFIEQDSGDIMVQNK